MKDILSHSPLLQAIFAHAASTPGKTAVVGVDGEAISYLDLKKGIISAAAFLSEAGLSSGDRLMLSAEKEIDFIYLYFGAHLSGIVNVVVDAKNNKENIDFIKCATTPSLCIGFKTEGMESYNYSEIKLPEKEVYLHPTTLTAESTADIMFTSGTTGKPKGVKLSHFNIYSSASNINGFIGNDHSDIELLALPICHSFGLGRLRCNLLSGATVVLHNGFANLKSVFDTIAKYNVTGFGMVPSVWAYIKKFSGGRIGRFANQIRYVEIGSAAMPKEDKVLLMEIFPDTRICMHYGLTEASRAIFMEFHEYAGHLDSLGKNVSPEVDVKIINDHGEEADAGEEGEICIKGNMVFTSYLDESLNEDAFADEYFRTGDWGYRSAEGDFFLVARKKELINIGGKKVSPLEIEEALSKIGIRESICMGIADPDGILGEVPKALLLKGSFSTSIDDIPSLLKPHLEAYKIPRIYEVVESLPKTASGKKQRINQ